VILSEGKHMKSVEDLDVFKLAHQLALKTYSLTDVPERRFIWLGGSNSSGRRYPPLISTFREFPKRGRSRSES
jgi:hypothetical protein